MKMTMRPATTPVPIRLDEKTRYRLRMAADKLGLNPSAVIRLAIHCQLPAIENGTIEIPPTPAPEPEAV